tara:strand:+ start:165 stop:2219 length:2055 start_codon:yes stop_codon:yes gene_type:complete
MFNIQLYIQGTRVDMFQDESVTLNQSIKQVQELDKVFLAFTQTFNLPATKTNNKLFEHYYEFDIVDGFDARFSKDAIIELDYLPFKTGQIKLNGVTLANNKPEQYNVTFFDNTVNIKDLFGDDKLNALTALNSNNKTFAPANIKAALLLDPASNDVVVPLITHTQRLFYNSVEHVQGSGNLYFESGGASTKHGVRWDNLKYAIRLHKIIEGIESKYSLNFTNDFFVSSNAAYYGLFMWLHRKKGIVSNGDQVTSFTEQIDGWTANTASISSMIDVRTLQINTTNTVTLLQLQFQRSVTTAFDLRVERNGIEVFAQDTITSSTATFDLTTDVIALSTFTVFITTTASMNFTDIIWTVNDGTAVDTHATGSYTTTAAFEFIITEQIPEMKVLDFLTGLFKMFNLVALKETNGDIYVDTLDNFYANKTSTGSPYDITEFLVRDSSTIDVALPYKEVSFRFEDTDTFFAATHNQLFNQEWGRVDFTQTETTDTVVGDNFEVTAPFSHMKFERLVDINDSTLTTIQWGFCVDDNQESYIGKPILFYPILNAIKDVTTAESISFIDDILADGTFNDHDEITASIVMPSNSVKFDSSVSTANINFNLEKNEYTRDSSFTGTLFENYYKNYIQGIFNKKRRLIKVEAFLPIRILQNFTLADKFIISEREYRINTIKTDLGTGRSQIELLNIV